MFRKGLEFVKVYLVDTLAAKERICGGVRVREKRGCLDLRDGCTIALMCSVRGVVCGEDCLASARVVSAEQTRGNGN